MPKSILETLREYTKSDLLPMHMPGHKRKPLSDALPYNIDLTEVGPFDALHNPESLLMEAMDNAASVYGSKHTHFLINGSSGGLLAAIRAMTCPKAIVSRQCHKSIFHAIELCNIMPEYISPKIDQQFGCAAQTDPDSIARAFEAAPDARLVIVTSPTYEGTISDIRAIADIAHAHGALLLVDEAHGAHLPFGDNKSKSALYAGADVVVQSLHKTLPSLTQTALLHIMTDRAPAKEIQRQLGIFETSSPSFLLLSSIDECIRLMAAKDATLIRHHEQLLDDFYREAQSLKNLRLRIPDDRLKLLIHGASLTGAQLSQILEQEFKIVAEMAMGSCALLMSTISDSQADLKRVIDALRIIDRRTQPAPPAMDIALPPLRQQIPIADALRMTPQFLPLRESVGRLCLEYIWAYPPGVPLLVPGARIGEDAISNIEALIAANTALHSTGGMLKITREIACG